MIITIGILILLCIGLQIGMCIELKYSESGKSPNIFMCISILAIILTLTGGAMLLHDAMRGF